MSVNTRILIDTNVVLDVLAKREPHYAASAAVWGLVEQAQVTGLLAAHSVTTLFYLTAKHLGQRRATSTISKLLQVFDIVAVDRAVLQQALALDWDDFEDAVQMASAFKANANYLVTRNPKDFTGNLVQVLQPAECLALFLPPNSAA